VYRELQRARGVANALQNLGSIALRLGELPEAHAYYEEALAVLAGTGDDRQIALGMAEFGRVATRMGSLEAGRVRFATALGISRSLGARREMAYSLEGATELASRLGAHSTAATLFGAAGALREDLGSPPTAAEARDQESLLDGLRGAIGPESLDRDLARGRAMTFDEAVEHALEWLEGAAVDAVGSAGPTSRV
jgi:tetratricopeptide (TPR) repeat protein